MSHFSALIASVLISSAGTLAFQHVPPGAQGNTRCPCSSPSLCHPVTATPEREVFGFSISRDTPYEKYDWSQLTTVAWNEDPALMCVAHAAGARVVLDGRGANPPSVLGNRTARAGWLAKLVQHAVDNYLDGINFDLEDPLGHGNPLVAEYSALVAEAAAAFHAAIPGSQVSVDVPWSPYGIDGRSYDWPSLAQAADLLFVMAYDMQSQMWGRCVAAANSPLALVRRGLEHWLDAGVPRSKLVLGLPWYGYLYPCINIAFTEAQEQELCQLPAVGFRGAPCSDAAGQQVCFSDIAAMVRRGRTRGNSIGSSSSDSNSGITTNHNTSIASGSRRSSRTFAVEAGASAEAEGLELQHVEQDGVVCGEPRVDAVQASPFAQCRRPSAPANHTHQVWFDDPTSLRPKYALAADLGLRGVGMWHLNCLDYRCTELSCRQQTEGMWAALRAFTSTHADALEAID